MGSPAPMQRFRDAAKEYMKDNRFSDFEITCDGVHFPVHRLFISAQSDYFRRICEGNYAESNLRVIHLQGDRVEAVSRMIEFFYAFDYDDTVNDKQSGLASIDGAITYRVELNAWVYAVADKYGVPDLRDLAVQKFKKATLASTLNDKELSNAVRTVYQDLSLPECDRVLHEALVDALIKRPGLSASLRSELLTNISFDVPQYLVDLNNRLFDKLQPSNFCVKCVKKMDLAI